jgi:hypothetical protein
MATRTALAGTYSSGDFVDETDLNSIPGGWIGYFEKTSDQSGITTSATALTGLSGTVTVNTSRRIRVSAFARFNSGTATDDFTLSIQESSTDIATTSIVGDRTNVTFGAFVSVILTPSSGSHTYTCVGGLAAGTGPVTLQASSTHKAYLLVEDLGPQ